MCKCFDLKQRVSFAGWQFGVLKICAICFGIIIGTYFADFFRNYYVLLWTIVAVTWAFAAAWWFRALEQSDPKNKS